MTTLRQFNLHWVYSTTLGR